jgi:dCMP deaminase
MKLAKSNDSGDRASMFVTHSPCLECAKGIYQAGIIEVYYQVDYRSTDGIDFLKKCGIKIEKIDK